MFFDRFIFHKSGWAQRSLFREAKRRNSIFLSDAKLCFALLASLCLAIFSDNEAATLMSLYPQKLTLYFLHLSFFFQLDWILIEFHFRKSLNRDRKKYSLRKREKQFVEDAAFRTFRSSDDNYSRSRWQSWTVISGKSEWRRPDHNKMRLERIRTRFKRFLKWC